MRETIIGKNEAGQRLDKYLSKYMKGAPVSFFYKMLRKKNIVLNKTKATGKEILKEGDTVSLYLADDTIASFQPENSQNQEFIEEIEAFLKAFHTMRDIKVLYEDEDVCIVNKPSGILCQKAKKEDLSVNDWLIGYLLEERGLNCEQLKTFRPSICNRLDRNTSGILCCSKTLKASRTLNSLLAKRDIHKFYRCLIQGSCKKEGIIKAYLYKDEKRNKVTIYRSDDEIPKERVNSTSLIETEIKSVDHYQNITELEVKLITGKSHQIRAQLSDLNMPLIGDLKYGGSKREDGQMLHCYRLEFPRKVLELPQLNNKIIVCETPWKNEIRKICVDKV